MSVVASACTYLQQIKKKKKKEGGRVFSIFVCQSCCFEKISFLVPRYAILFLLELVWWKLNYSIDIFLPNNKQRDFQAAKLSFLRSSLQHFNPNNTYLRSVLTENQQNYFTIIFLMFFAAFFQPIRHQQLSCPDKREKKTFQRMSEFSLF